MAKASKKILTPIEKNELLGTLKKRFEKNITRHKNIEWNSVLVKLESSPEKLWSLNEMEKTGGEPDVVAFDIKLGEYTFFDCATESPIGRRSFCYDRKALEERKKFKPENSVLDMAASMGIDLLSEKQYRELQTLGAFDLKTSSWIQTPDMIRKLGGALFADFRYEHVFIYHNGAESYYVSRGFRGALVV